VKPLACTLLLLAFLEAADDAQDPAMKTELKKLEGRYTISSAEVNGAQIDQQPLEQFKLTVSGNNWSVAMSQGKIEAIIDIDPSKNPKTIDFTYTEGSQKGQTTRGIYALDGDVLKLCRTLTADKERPAEFSTQPESGFLMVIWKKTKG
jgi:uncharacterized protein (TIGR03067 family)